MIKIEIDTAELREMAESGAYSTKALTRHFGVNPGTIYNRLKTMRIANAYTGERRPTRCEIPAEDILRMHRNGMSWADIGRHYGRADSTIIRVLKRAGVFKTTRRISKAEKVHDKDIDEMLSVAAAYDQRLKRAGLLK